MENAYPLVVQPRPIDRCWEIYAIGINPGRRADMEGAPGALRQAARATVWLPVAELTHSRRHRSPSEYRPAVRSSAACYHMTCSDFRCSDSRAHPR
jgi:hypothetical protein